MPIQETRQGPTSPWSPQYCYSLINAPVSSQSPSQELRGWRCATVGYCTGSSKHLHREDFHWNNFQTLNFLDQTFTGRCQVISIEEKIFARFLYSRSLVSDRVTVSNINANIWRTGEENKITFFGNITSFRDKFFNFDTFLSVRICWGWVTQSINVVKNCSFRGFQFIGSNLSSLNIFRGQSIKGFLTLKSLEIYLSVGKENVKNIWLKFSLLIIQ